MASVTTRVPKFLLLVALAAILFAACESQDATQSAVDETVAASASDAGGSPDVAQAAVNETCAALTHLQQEWRPGRVGDDQWHAAYDDILTSLVAAGERVGRPLGPDVSARCPNAWHDTNEVFEELRAENEATLVDLHCQLLIVIRPVVGYTDLNYAKEYDDLRSKLDALALTEAVAEYCPEEWQDGIERRASVRQETAEAAKRPEVEEKEQQQAQVTATPTPRAVTVASSPAPAVSTPSPVPVSPTARSPTPGISGASSAVNVASTALPENRSLVDREVLLTYRPGAGLSLLDIKAGTLQSITEFFGLPDRSIDEFALSPSNDRLAIAFPMVNEDRTYMGDEMYLLDLIKLEITHVELNLMKCTLYGFEWSPDGSRILFGSTHIGGHVPTCQDPSTYVLEVGTQRLLANSSEFGYEALSEDGAKVFGWIPSREQDYGNPVAAGKMAIYNIAEESLEKLDIVVSETDISDAYVYAFSPLAVNWSPNRSRVAMWGRKSPGPPVDNRPAEGSQEGVFVISGSNEEWSIDPSWIPIEGWNSSRILHWSPSGLYLALLVDLYDDSERDNDVFIIDIQSGDGKWLSSIADEFQDFSNPTWIPDGSSIGVMASTAEGDDRYLVVADVMDGNVDHYALLTGIETAGNIGFSLNGRRAAIGGCITQCHDTMKEVVLILDMEKGGYDEIVTMSSRPTSFTRLYWIGVDE